MVGIKNGEIWMAEIPLINEMGSVQGGRRPIYICSNNKFNNGSPVVNYYPLTSRINKNSPVHIIVGKECGLKVKSAIMIECPGTIDKRNILFKIGECPKTIKKAIFIANAFQQGYCSEIKYKEKLAACI